MPKDKLNVLNQCLVLDVGISFRAKREVGVNAKGIRVGEFHQRAKLSDDDVALILQVIEDADNDKAAGKKYLHDSEIAEKFEISKGHLHNIRYGLQRAQAPERYKRIFEKEK